MNDLNFESRQPIECNLNRLIEPLADYVSASDQPSSTHRLALALLQKEIDRINKAANDYLSHHPKEGN